MRNIWNKKRQEILAFRKIGLLLQRLRQRQCFMTTGGMGCFYAHLLAYILQGYKAVKSRRMLITPCYRHCLWRDREATAFTYIRNSILFRKCQRQEVLEWARSIVAPKPRPTVRQLYPYPSSTRRKTPRTWRTTSFSPMACSVSSATSA